MNDIKKEIESLKNIGTFGDLIAGKEEVLCFDEVFWFDGKLALVPLSELYTYREPFPSYNVHKAYILPVGVSERDALESYELSSIRCYQWLKVKLTREAVITKVEEVNLGIAKCMMSFKHDFRMEQINLNE